MGIILIGRTQRAVDVPIDSSVSGDGVSVSGNYAEAKNVQEFIDFVCPATESVSAAYRSDGEVSGIEFFVNATQIQSNRKMRVDISYDGNINPTTEIWHIYDTDGVTIVKTVSITHTFTGVDWTGSSAVTS